MARVPKSATSLSKFSRAMLEKEDFPDMIHEIRNAPDRSAGIVAAAFLEAALEDAIQHYMVDLSKTEAKELFEGDAPLASFSAKIRIARAFGIAGKKMTRDLNRIRTIRNAFAHSARHVSFSTPEVSAVCGAMQYPHNIKNPKDFKGIQWPLNSARRTYMATALLIWLALMNTFQEYGRKEVDDLPLD